MDGPYVYITFYPPKRRGASGKLIIRGCANNILFEPTSVEVLKERLDGGSVFCGWIDLGADPELSQRLRDMDPDDRCHVLEPEPLPYEEPPYDPPFDERLNQEIAPDSHDSADHRRKDVYG